MRIHRSLPTFGILLMVPMLTSGCLTIPKLEDRIVELVATGSVTQAFHAQGGINYLINDVSTFALDTQVTQALNDAGLDASDLVSVKLNTVEYHVTTGDANSSSRAITGGNITVQRQTPSPPAAAAIVSGFTAPAGAPTGWTVATLTPAGVTTVNNILADILTKVKNPAAVMPTNYNVVRVVVSGSSTPTNVNTDFYYEIRLTISVVGKLKTKMLST